MARERGLTSFSATRGDHVSGRLTGVVNLVSGRFPMIENGLEFQLVPWQPLVENALASTSSASNATTAASRVASGNQRGLGLSAQNRSDPPTISRFRCAVCAVRTGFGRAWQGRASPSNRIVLDPRCLLNRPQCRVKRIFRRRQYPQAFSYTRKDAVLRDSSQMRALTLRGGYTSCHSELDPNAACVRGCQRRIEKTWLRSSLLLSGRRRP
jgi:uncharacterized protein DUF3363